MGGNLHLSAAALMAGIALSFAVAAQQNMYRCGNKYQDKPCEDGQKGRVVGTTGAPPPAAAAAKRKTDPAVEQRRAAESHMLYLQSKAQKCVQLRRQVSEAGRSWRARESYQGDMRRLGCAHVGAGGWDREDACAKSMSTDEGIEACRTYEQGLKGD